jgi:flagellar biogenesis protein FliO
MRLPHKHLRVLLLLALALLGLECSVPAAPAVSQGKSAGPVAPAATPDYGGRDSIVSTAVATSGAQTMNPLVQAGRAFEALLIVLALVVGCLYLLKRSGLLQGGGDASAATPWARRLPQAMRQTASRHPFPPEISTDLIKVLGSQTLPHGSGAGLHLISVGGKTLLLGETVQAVTLLTELDSVALPEQETPQERAAFADYLAQAGISLEPAPQARAVEYALSATADRLQSLLSRSREETTHS